MLSDDEIADLLVRPADALDELDRLDCEESLLGFTKRHWSILEPGRQLSIRWPLEAICEHLEAITYGQINRLLINVPPGFMKLIADETPILTPDGYRRHGDLAVGDSVFSPDGTPAKVVRISEKATADYEVTFSTHETIKCNGDHLWTVFDRWARKWKTVDTRTLAEAQPDKGRSRFFLPDTEALQFPEARLPLHPYLLGCWLGDGSASKPAITHDVDDGAHINKIEALGYLVTTRHRAGRTVASYFAHQGIIQTIRAAGLYKNKHIPRAYIESSIEQRCELLAGLIDTDGTVDQKRGRALIYTTEPALAEQIQLLVLSLGMRPYMTTMPAPGYGDYKSSKTYHIVGFQPTMPLPTAIPRKEVDGRNFERRRRAIVSVQKAERPSIGHCITIDRPDGLYVVGRTNVVTHNSLLCNVFWPAWEWGPMSLTAMRYVNFSYSAMLTERDNRRFRDVMLNHDYGRLFGDRFSLVKTGEQLVSNDRTGWKLATSVGGVGTGERGDRVVLDDPHNVRDGESDAVRQGTVTWFREAMSNRLNDRNSAIVIIMQRVHEEDVSGVVLSELQNEYEHLCIPYEWEGQKMISTVPNMVWSEDPRTVEGEEAWPARLPLPWKQFKITLGPYATASQYQQSPTPRGGGIFKRDWWKLWEMYDPEGKLRFPQCEFILASLDGAFGQDMENDYTALTIWGVFREAPGILPGSTRQQRPYLEQLMREQSGISMGAPPSPARFTKAPRIILMHAWRKRLPLNGEEIAREPGETDAAYRARSMPHWGIVQWVADSCRRFRVHRLLVEAKANGHDVANEVRRQHGGEGWGVQLIDPGRLDKVARAYSVQHLPADGMIYYVDREWSDEVITEMSVFPKGGHDDYTDTATQAWKWLRDAGLAQHGHEIEREIAEMMQNRSLAASKPLYPT